MASITVRGRLCPCSTGFPCRTVQACCRSSNAVFSSHTCLFNTKTVHVPFSVIHLVTFCVHLGYPHVVYKKNVPMLCIYAKNEYQVYFVYTQKIFMLCTLRIPTYCTYKNIDSCVHLSIIICCVHLGYYLCGVL